MRRASAREHARADRQARAARQFAGRVDAGDCEHDPITKVELVRRRDGSLAERIDIQRDDGRRCALGWSKRVLVLRQPTEAEDWLRRQLEGLKR